MPFEISRPVHVCAYIRPEFVFLCADSRCSVGPRAMRNSPLLPPFSLSPILAFSISPTLSLCLSLIRKPTTVSASHPAVNHRSPCSPVTLRRLRQRPPLIPASVCFLRDVTHRPQRCSDLLTTDVEPLTGAETLTGPRQHGWSRPNGSSHSLERTLNAAASNWRGPALDLRRATVSVRPGAPSEPGSPPRT